MPGESKLNRVRAAVPTGGANETEQQRAERLKKISEAREQLLQEEIDIEAEDLNKNSYDKNIFVPSEKAKLYEYNVNGQKKYSTKKLKHNLQKIEDIQSYNVWAKANGKPELILTEDLKADNEGYFDVSTGHPSDENSVMEQNRNGPLPKLVAKHHYAQDFMDIKARHGEDNLTDVRKAYKDLEESHKKDKNEFHTHQAQYLSPEKLIEFRKKIIDEEQKDREGRRAKIAYEARKAQKYEHRNIDNHYKNNADVRFHGHHAKDKRKSDKKISKWRMIEEANIDAMYNERATDRAERMIDKYLHHGKEQQQVRDNSHQSIKGIQKSKRETEQEELARNLDRHSLNYQGFNKIQEDKQGISNEEYMRSEDERNRPRNTLQAIRRAVNNQHHYPQAYPRLIHMQKQYNNPYGHLSQFLTGAGASAMNRQSNKDGDIIRRQHAGGDHVMDQAVKDAVTHRIDPLKALEDLLLANMRKKHKKGEKVEEHPDSGLVDPLAAGAQKADEYAEHHQKKKRSPILEAFMAGMAALDDGSNTPLGKLGRVAEKHRNEMREDDFRDEAHSHRDMMMRHGLAKEDRAEKMAERKMKMAEEQHHAHLRHQRAMEALQSQGMSYKQAQHTYEEMLRREKEKKEEARYERKMKMEEKKIDAMTGRESKKLNPAHAAEAAALGRAMAKPDSGLTNLWMNPSKEDKEKMKGRIAELTGEHSSAPSNHVQAFNQRLKAVGYEG